MESVESVEAVFSYLLERSAGAGIVIAAVIALRYVLRDAPKAFRMVLWAVVALRLLCPYVPESPWGVIPEPARDFAAVTPSAPVPEAANLPENAIVVTPLNPAELYPLPARETSAQAAQISPYWPDVRAKFPKSLTDAELDTQTYIVQETQDCYRQAVERWSVDVTPVLDELFDKIAESPATSSNPGDYLNAHPLEVRELLYYGDYTRAYIYERVGGAPGLRQHLMQLVLERLDALTWNQPGAVTDLSGLGKLVHATLTHIHDYTGPEPLPGTYALSDAEKLSALRELLTGAEALNGPPKRPFEDVLTLTDENGVTLQLALAADSCAVCRFAGRYYKYDADNAKLYALFT